MKIKVLLLILLFNCFYSKDVAFAEMYDADKFLKRTNSLNGLERYMYFSEHLSKINDRYQDTVLYFANEAVNASEELNLEHIKGLANYFYANYYLSKGKISKSFENAFNAAEILQQYNDTFNLARVYNEIGVIYFQLGNFNKSAFYYRKSVDLIQYSGNKDLLFAFISNMASVVSLIDNDEAIELLQDLYLDIDSSEIDKKASIHISLADFYCAKNEEDSVLDHANKAFTYYKKSGNVEGLGIYYSTLSIYYTNRNEFEQALVHLEEAIKSAEIIRNKPMLIGRLLNKVYLLTQLGRLEQSSQVLGRVKSLMEEDNIVLRRESYYKESARLYKKLGDYRESNQFLIRLLLLKDSFITTKNAEYIAVLKTEFDLARKESEIEILSKENKIQKLQQQRIIIAGSLLIFLLVIIGFAIWIKRNKDKVIARQSQEILKLEVLEKGREQEKIQTELDFKVQQLFTKSLELTQKNQFLSSLAHEVEEIKKDLPTESASKANKLKRQLKQHTNLEKDWLQLREYFEKVNPRFYDYLIKRNSGLTKSETRLATLIKLQLDTQDCADILHVSTQSIKTARHRLKKKLNLSIDESLDSFIRSIA